MQLKGNGDSRGGSTNTSPQILTHDGVKKALQNGIWLRKHEILQVTIMPNFSIRVL